MANRKPLVVAFVSKVDGAVAGIQQMAKEVTSFSKKTEVAERAVGQLGDETQDQAKEAARLLRGLGVKREASHKAEVARREEEKRQLKAMYAAGLISAGDYERGVISANKKIERSHKSVGLSMETAWTKSLAKIKTRLTSFSSSARASMRRVGVGAAAGLATAGIVGGITARQVSQAADYADEITKLSRQTNISTEALSAYSYAAEQSGLSQKTLFNAAKEMVKVLDGGGKAFADLGVRTQNADGSFRAFGDLIPEVVDSLNEIEDPIKRAAKAAEIFGLRSGPEMASFIALGSKGLEEYTAKAERLGKVVDQQTGEAAERFNDRLDDLSQQYEGLRLQFSAPFFDPFAQSFEEIGALIERNSDAIKAFASAMASGVVDYVQDFIAILEGRNGDVKNEWLLEFVGFMKDLGGVIKDTVIPAIVWVVEKLKEMDPATAKIVVALALFGGAIAPVVAGLGTLAAGASAVVGMVGGWSALGTAIGAVAAAIAGIIGLPVAAVAAIGAGIVAAAVAIYIYWDEITAYFSATISKIGEWFTHALTHPFAALKDAALAALNYLNPIGLILNGVEKFTGVDIPLIGEKSAVLAAAAESSTKSQEPVATVNLQLEKGGPEYAMTAPASVAAALEADQNLKKTLSPTGMPRTFR